MGAMPSQITSLTIVYSTIYSGADQSKHQSSASLAFAWGIHRGPVNSPHKWPVTRKMFPFDDVIMYAQRVSIGIILMFYYIVRVVYLIIILSSSQKSQGVVRDGTTRQRIWIIANPYANLGPSFKTPYLSSFS